MSHTTPLAALLLLLSAAACPQSPPKADHPDLSGVPFQQWSTQGRRADIPWKFSALSVKLTFHQRIQAHFSIKLDGADLVKLGSRGNVDAFVQITDAAGREFRTYAEVDLTKTTADLRKQDVVIAWDAFVLPGEYRVAFALVHDDSGRRDYGEARLKVKPLRRDPLPAAWSRLPTVEFWEPNDVTLVDTIFQEKIAAALDLPFQAKRPLDLELIADLTPSRIFGGSPEGYRLYLSAALPALKVLAQVRTANGKVPLTALDLLKSRETLRQDAAAGLDWAVLKRIATAPDVNLVDARARLQPSALFLRQVLLRRIEEQQAAPPAGAHRRIFVILSSPLDLYSFPKVRSDLPACDCAVYYLFLNFLYHRYSREPVYGRRGWVRYFGVPDNVERMLAPLPVRSFDIQSPEDFRSALARILKDEAK